MYDKCFLRISQTDGALELHVRKRLNDCSLFVKSASIVESVYSKAE
jgi:hypothetical protein